MLGLQYSFYVCSNIRDQNFSYVHREPIDLVANYTTKYEKVLESAISLTVITKIYLYFGFRDYRVRRFGHVRRHRRLCIRNHRRLQTRHTLNTPQD